LERPAQQEFEDSEATNGERKSRRKEIGRLKTEDEKTEVEEEPMRNFGRRNVLCVRTNEELAELLLVFRCGKKEKKAATTLKKQRVNEL